MSGYRSVQSYPFLVNSRTPNNHSEAVMLNFVNPTRTLWQQGSASKEQ
jgi:hypothetical protein